jgi:hypothetical protein
MTTALDVARDPSVVNTELTTTFAAGVAAVLAKAEAGASARQLEQEVWGLALSLGQAVLAASMATACRRATEADLERRRLERGQVVMRTDRNYWATQMTTLGPVCFPLFAYRERRLGGTVTRTPARAEVVPLLGRCRSSEMCLEWEARLGKEHPFRRAQDAVAFFTHGAVREEDTTIAAHLVAVGSVVDRTWLYRPLSEIRRLLQERATCDAETGRPIVYVSTDAHAERRYVDETWEAAWKSYNGLRLWIVDRDSGETIHLGGEFTWGDCRAVGRIVETLIADGFLPVGGDYGEGVCAEVVVITDGLPWIEDYVLAKLPWAHPILDLMHALGHLSSFASKCFGAGTKAAKAFVRRVARHLIQAPRARTTVPVPRKGHRKSPRTSSRSRGHRVYGCIYAVLGTLYEDEQPTIPHQYVEDFKGMLVYFEHNAYRGDYWRYHARGFQIGSGAMESLHRTGAQMRLKLAGARWLPNTAQAIVNLRMLDLVGRWDEFWKHDGLPGLLQTAFGATPGPATAGARA